LFILVEMDSVGGFILASLGVVVVMPHCRVGCDLRQPLLQRASS
jgi:hypothetical protein